MKEFIEEMGGWNDFCDYYYHGNLAKLRRRSNDGNTNLYIKVTAITIGLYLIYRVLNKDNHSSGINK